MSYCCLRSQYFTHSSREFSRCDCQYVLSAFVRKLSENICNHSTMKEHFTTSKTTLVTLMVDDICCDTPRTNVKQNYLL